jgi:hypothetical protein
VGSSWSDVVTETLVAYSESKVASKKIKIKILTFLQKPFRAPIAKPLWIYLQKVWREGRSSSGLNIETGRLEIRARRGRSLTIVRIFFWALSTSPTI